MVAIAAGLLILGLIAALVLRRGALAWRRGHAALESALVAAARDRPASTVDLEALSDLPAPVARYLRSALRDGQPRIELLRFAQQGELRQDPGGRWSPFAARQVVAPGARGFVWDARARMAPGLTVRIRDSYFDGHGGGRVALWSSVEVARAASSLELDSAALLRYLAEAAWYPTALLPGAGLHWLPRDDASATAELTDRGTTVRLDFHFDAEDRLVRVESSGRHRRVGDGYELTPWRGHFGDHERHAGMLIPMRGRVEWMLDGAWQAVWRGRMSRVRFDLTD